MSQQKGITLYLHIHQPWRVRDYSVFETAHNHQYFTHVDDPKLDNRAIFLKVADKSYRPMNALLLRLLREVPDFKVSFSITGTFIEQAQAWAPELIEDYKAMVATGKAEIVGETYHHSLAFFYSRDEFVRQVEMHRDTIEDIFGVRPRAFRNTELSYNDDLAKWADEYGIETILAEGWDPILGWRSPNFVYRPTGTEQIRLLMKNYRLSDDVAFRFSNKDWSAWPLTVPTYRHWIDETLLGEQHIINLFMDFETFGEHQWEDTGIFNFFDHFVRDWCASEDRTFYTVTEASHVEEPRDEISMPHTVTWADSERDLTAWIGNDLQREALRHIYDLEHDVMMSGNLDLINDWRKLQTSDHFYYMCTKWFSDGDVHAYFSPYESPYDAFLYFMNALRDMRYRTMESHRYGGNYG